MKTLALITILASARLAAADPTIVTGTIDESELSTAWTGLTDSTEEPAGKRLTATDATHLAKLKLAAGDVILSVDGHPALGMARFHPYELGAGNVIYLEVARGAQRIVVRAAYPIAATAAGTIQADSIVALAADPTRNYRAVTKNGKRSGVFVIASDLAFHSGDVIRSIDGVAVTAPDQVSALLTKAVAKGTTVVKLDRDDVAVTLTATIVKAVADDVQEAVDAGIKKIDDTHYTISKALVEKILANPMAVAKGARVVPSIKDGKPNGFKLYAIRPSSMYARLGLANGDTIMAINGLSLSSADKALEVYTKLRDAKALTVDITRRGKSLTLNYSIR